MRKDRGFVIVAQNNSDTDYLLCAEVLARSIKRVMPNESIALVTDIDSMMTYRERADKNGTPYDVTYAVPFKDYDNDTFRIATDCQVYEFSPYEQTIKLEADIFIPNDISWWFDVLKDRDLAIATTIRDHANNISKNRFYRKFIDANALPDTYNAITYFKKSDIAKQFYAIVSDVFLNWNSFKPVYTLPDIPTTDEVYAIAASILGVKHAVMPTFTEMSMIHMKNFILDIELEDWTNQLLYEFTQDNFKIETIPQLYPIHYHVKSFADILYQELMNE